ncbi:MAG: thiamine-phosphate kinase [Deltaproteobacteria bacterium]|nr:thiamine-phosphate kinase [Deltaproteobacteria bacterium]
MGLKKFNNPSSQDLAQFSEDQIIQLIRKTCGSKHSSVLCGMGDDAAVTKNGKPHLVFTTDALQENIHFTWKTISPFYLGRKLLAVNLSDLAAMGAKPRWALLSLAIPRNAPLLQFQEFLKGLQSSLKEYSVSLIGGDTDHSLMGWRVSMTLIGESSREVLRSKAQIGDDIWVTGHLGYSALGFNLLSKRKISLQKPGLQKFIRAHQNPTPRIKIGEFLNRSKMAHAMMDVSDGFLKDLGRLCRASRCGALIEWKHFHLSSVFKKYCDELNLSPESLVLAGGEDYELIFTASPQHETKILKAFQNQKLSVSKVGKIVERPKKAQVLDAEGKTLLLSTQGYSHFS